MPCGKRDIGVVSKMGQSLEDNQNQPHMVLIIRSAIGVQLQVIVDVKWSLKWAKVLSWSNNQPKLATCAR